MVDLKGRPVGTQHRETTIFGFPRMAQGSESKRGLAFDDESVAVRRKLGSGKKPVVVFLPWYVSLERAEKLGLLPPHYLAAYEMPAGIISSSPDICVESTRQVVADFEALTEPDHPRQAPLVLVGLSIGNVPATYLANKHRLRLISVSSGARGEWLIFNSRAAVHIKRKASRKGNTPEMFETALKGWNPIDNLKGIDERSTFVFGRFDSFVARESQLALIEQIHQDSPSSTIWQLPLGHRGAILAWRFLPLSW